MTQKHNPPLVLVADDEQHTTLMLKRIFEREGYQVECAFDGIAALDQARRIMPDLLLLDIQMPGMNGFDVLRALREQSVTASIPTIVITAKAREPSDVAHGLNLGADDYVYKPFEPRELVARAKSKMRARQLEESLQRRTQELQALLRVGEELNHSLEILDLLTLVLYLSLDLLPGDTAAICQYDDELRLRMHHLEVSDPELTAPDIDQVAYTFLQQPNHMMWPGDQPLSEELPFGMATPLQHGDTLLGMLMIASHQQPYDENHMRLFRGIGRQASLALRNAQLYEIQANYALHLEDMVAERTAELESAQQMLIRSEKLASVGHLAASIAHEINNPLQPIQIHLEHILEDIQEGSSVDPQSVQSIQESIERITRIVRQLLEFTGKRSPISNVQFIQIEDTIEGVIKLNQKLFEQNGISIVADITPLPPIYGSKDQLEQVFMNLMLNAQSAMDTGGTLWIKTRQRGDQISISFKDNGCGIPNNELSRIFDPFYSTKASGTGLGLFVSYGIIQNHQGSIAVDSEVGVGTTFTITLPIDAVPQHNES